MIWREGTVLSLGKNWPGAQECMVECEGEKGKALAYTEITGVPEVSDRVLLQASAMKRGLGTGGYMYICAIPDRLPLDSPQAPGHIVKARYTPLQYMTLGVDEQESPWHELLENADSISGMPVIVADLHSALPAAIAGIRSIHPQAKIAYIMNDGGALPAWFSRSAAELKSAGYMMGTISCGQAFGGDLEAVNIYTALLAARLVWEADIAIVAQGPGNLGTGTRWGYSGTYVGDVINAVNVLGGCAIGLLRMSNADARGRHHALSHHTTTALLRVAHTPALCPVPVLGEDELSRLVSSEVRDDVNRGLEELFACQRLTRVDVEASLLVDELVASPVRLSTMGRGLTEDSLNFLAAAAAGYVAGQRALNM
ncbi:DUF3866 family protein [Actinotignum urinale]|uniref:DUF3866 family protein n=1 Tax=Actinotignum urinale TaxID=190146 RepID=UPI002A8316C5|nr:DUF3866 family protein [Actinotignum urinale]MDY5152109.1 DUF3866 family protein [Actinotignum urinale]